MDRLGVVEVDTAIGERIGSDVEDSHHQGGSSLERKFPAARKDERHKTGRDLAFLRARPSALVLHLAVPLSHDPRAEGVEALLDPLIAAIDLIDVLDHALTLGAERGEEEGHAGADGGAGDLRAIEPAAPDDDGPVRVA